MVPKVANDSVKADGTLGLNEYGSFTGVTVTPGVSAWILNWPEDRAWDNAQDSSFTFWLAHDDNYLYVGIKAQDDVVNSDDPNGSFWKDDAIEIVTDALADGFDNNTDSSKDPVGGHSYVNFQGRLSAWDENAGAKGSQGWANEVDWKYGASGDVFGKGAASPAVGRWRHVFTNGCLRVQRPATNCATDTGWVSTSDSMTTTKKAPGLMGTNPAARISKSSIFGQTVNGTRVWMPITSLPSRPKIKPLRFGAQTPKTIRSSLMATDGCPMPAPGKSYSVTTRIRNRPGRFFL